MSIRCPSITTDSRMSNSPRFITAGLVSCRARSFGVSFPFCFFFETTLA
ncbi:unnamed protein product [Amoebophrya sp. A25]|nr:unnamed protein product [Amoebophrya sp. A25]|eukprot:GSA25T00015651001.1